MKKVFFLCFIALVHSAYAVNVTGFVAPDNSFNAFKMFASDAQNLKIATYTFTSPSLMEIIKDKNITIIIEKSPVGGRPIVEEKILCTLQERGGRIFLYDGDLRFHHAKYIMKDNDAVLVSTENLGDNGYPKNNDHGNRGLGIIVESKNITAQFLHVFQKDMQYSVPFSCRLTNYSLYYNKKSGEYSSVFDIRVFDVKEEYIRSVFAPDALPDLLELIKQSEHNISVAQFYIHKYFDKKEKEKNPLLVGLVNKSEEGVGVNILLDSSWYNVQENDMNSNLNTMEYVNTISKKKNVELKAKLFDSVLKKLHAKALIADDTVLISSINWNKNSITRNREVGVIIENTELAGYFRNVFDYEWHNKEDGVGGNLMVLSGLGVVFVVLLLFFLLIR